VLVASQRMFREYGPRFEFSEADLKSQQVFRFYCVAAVTTWFWVLAPIGLFWNVCCCLVILTGAISGAVVWCGLCSLILRTWTGSNLSNSERNTVDTDTSWKVVVPTATWSACSTIRWLKWTQFLCHSTNASIRNGPSKNW
jgi:hypothetical protein